MRRASEGSLKIVLSCPRTNIHVPHLLGICEHFSTFGCVSCKWCLSIKCIQLNTPALEEFRVWIYSLHECHWIFQQRSSCCDGRAQEKRSTKSIWSPWSCPSPPPPHSSDLLIQIFLRFRNIPWYHFLFA